MSEVIKSEVILKRDHELGAKIVVLRVGTAQRSVDAGNSGGAANRQSSDLGFEGKETGLERARRH